MTHRMIAWRGGVVGLLAVCAFARLSISGDFRVFHFQTQSCLKRVVGKMKCRLIAAPAILLAENIVGTTAFLSNTRATLKPVRPIMTAREVALGLDDEISRWAKEAGYGDVTSSKPNGSSGWASFKRVSLSDGPDLFVKSSGRSCKDMFEGEALGLQAMFECNRGEDGLRIPEVFHYGDLPDGKGSFLIMEYFKGSFQKAPKRYIIKNTDFLLGL